MKTILRNIFIVLLLVLINSASAEPPKEFRGIAWGTNIKSLSGMKLVESDGDTKYYVRKGDKRAIGQAAIDEISYGFYKDRFYLVIILAKGLQNFDALKRTMAHAYGEPIQPNEYLESYHWGIRSDVFIKLELNEISKGITAVYMYKPISDEARADKEAVARKGMQDL